MRGNTEKVNIGGEMKKIEYIEGMDKFYMHDNNDVLDTIVKDHV
jgi:hypothetical protein